MKVYLKHNLTSQGFFQAFSYFSRVVFMYQLFSKMLNQFSKLINYKQIKKSNLMR